MKAGSDRPCRCSDGDLFLDAPQNSVGLNDRYRGDGAGADVGVGHGVNTQIVRIPRWPHMRHIAAVEQDTHPICAFRS